MTQAITNEQMMMDEFKKLSAEKQQEVIDFMQFLQFQAQKQEVQQEEAKPISFLEAAKDFIGCVDGGPGDLATNKKYLEKLGR